jgi:hypothetical protein
MIDIVREIAREQDLHFKLAVITRNCRERLSAGTCATAARALPPVAPLSDADIDATTRIVGMIGVEPIQQALTAGAHTALAIKVSFPRPQS